MIINLPSQDPVASVAHTVFRAAFVGAVWTGVIVAVQMLILAVFYGSGAVLSAFFGMILGAGVSFLVWLPGLTVAVLFARYLIRRDLLAHPRFWPIWTGTSACLAAFLLSLLSTQGIGVLISYLPILSPAPFGASSAGQFSVWNSLLAAAICGSVGIWVGASLGRSLNHEKLVSSG
ncbi:hypothetical protein [Rhodophyticola porphyridii]|uniref:Uncharacterized protein n=1 Tax=Rhodophyticola porphyridii TaxID=1852017 RepID=A0A3L9Y4N7_9RHOB|nr:hypothetical protein [Rhodophyticola porphyridii]RMA41096.1 hypothetical protein D9R08_16580 [Rhodophyticola porphyridii]